MLMAGLIATRGVSIVNVIVLERVFSDLCNLDTIQQRSLLVAVTIFGK
jgi:hypothetical protein